MPLDSTIEGNSKMLLKALSTSLMLFDRKSLLLKIFDSLNHFDSLKIYYKSRCYGFRKHGHSPGKSLVFNDNGTGFLSFQIT